jgi:hypothetical protein
MNNEIHSLVDFGSARTLQLTTRSTKWRHINCGYFIHSSIHQTYILAVHASIHAQILPFLALLALYAYGLRLASRRRVQERVYQYKGGLRDL